MTAHTNIAKLSAYKKSPTMRLWNPGTGKFLHQSGVGEVVTPDYAWSGHVKQARVLRDLAASWPYKRRDIGQREEPSW